MSKKKASITALITASLILTYSLYKPSDHEAVSESPTQPQVVLVPAIADDIPKPAVVAKPAKEIKPEVSPPKPIKKVEPKTEVITVEATHYTADCDGCSGITKTGIDVRKTIYHKGYRIVAVDPSIIALNSLIRVKYDDGTTFKAIASDIGGDIKKSRIDILVDSKSEAYELGRQKVKVEILMEGSYE